MSIRVLGDTNVLPEPARDLQAELEERERELVLAERAQRFIRDQLHEARRVVDREQEFGRGYACIVEAIRSAPTRPRGVHEFANVVGRRQRQKVLGLLGG